MGWAFGINEHGREIGYGVRARCDEPSCRARIDRGLAYRCGGGANVLDSAIGCGNFYCGKHLRSYLIEDMGRDIEEWSESICKRCGAAWTTERSSERGTS